MKDILFLVFILLLAAPLNSFSDEENPKDRVWYKVNESDDVNSIYVDYTSIKRKEKTIDFEQMEFLLEKQKIEGSDKEYKFIVSKRTANCKDKKYRVNEEKYYDININEEKNEIKDEMVYKNKYEDKTEEQWIMVNPDSLVEKVWRFVCLYKSE
jgi:hypothetical protein